MVAESRTHRNSVGEMEASAAPRKQDKPRISFAAVVEAHKTASRLETKSRPALSRSTSSRFRAAKLSTVREKRQAGKRIVIRNQKVLLSDSVHHSALADLRQTKKVYVKFNIFNVFAIDTSIQQFQAKLNLEATWEDSSLNGIEEKDINWEKVWKPNHQRYVNLYDLDSSHLIPPRYHLFHFLNAL